MNTKILRIALLIMLTVSLGSTVSYAGAKGSSSSGLKLPRKSSNARSSSSSGFKNTARYKTPKPKENYNRYNRNDYYEERRKNNPPEEDSRASWKKFRKKLPVYHFFKALEEDEDDEEDLPSSAPDTDAKLEAYCRGQYSDGLQTYKDSPNRIWYAYQGLSSACKGWFGPAPKKHPENVGKSARSKSKSTRDLSSYLAKSEEAVGTSILIYVDPPKNNKYVPIKKKTTPIKSPIWSPSSRSNNPYYSFSGKSVSNSWYKAPSKFSSRGIRSARSRWVR